MKHNKPHGQWIVLSTIIRLPPFGQTAKIIAEHTKPMLSNSGTRTRLSELEAMSLVVGWKNQNHRHRQYMATPNAWRIINAGVNGMTALHHMGNTRAILESQRAIELAPIKEKWAGVIKQRMQMSVQAHLGPEPQLHPGPNQ